MKQKLWLIICLVFLMIIPVNAEVKTFERTSENNYLVRKKWVINDRNINNVLNTKSVDATEKVYDFANILNDSERENLRYNINNFINKTQMDMVILTINEPYTYDSLNEDIAADFYDYNDFGINYKHYSGILLLRNAYENDPYYDIYTFGEAQLYFDYDRLNIVLDKIYDDLHNKNYLSGMNDFIYEISSYYDKGIPSKYENAYIDEYGEIRFIYKYTPPYKIALIVSGIVSIIVLLILCKKNKMVKQAMNANEYLDGEIDYRRKDVNLVNSFVTHHIIHDDNDRNSGGGHGFGGGFHSSGSHGSFGSSGHFHSSGGGRHG